MEVDWQPYELNPATPPGGTRLVDKFGPRYPAMRERVINYAAEFGLTDWKLPEVTVNTRKVLALAERARDRGTLDEFRDAAMNAHWREGKTLTDLATLEELGAKAGLTAEEVRRAIEDPELLGRVDRAREKAESMGVTGIPTFFIGPYRVVGCQPYEVLAEVIERVRG